MALMSDIVNDVLIELRFGAGQDVQIHLQEGIVANVSRLYRTLMLKHVWRDWHSIGEYTTDATGQIVEDITAVLTKFTDIIAVYIENSNEPLSVAPAASNPFMIKRPALVASYGAKVFTIWPKVARNIVVVSRVFSEDNFEMDDDVPFYRDVLALGAAYMLSVKAGTNQELTKSLQSQFGELLEVYRMKELQTSYQLNTQFGTVPMEWYENGH